jgi:LEA14-like dessication related protein
MKRTSTVKIILIIAVIAVFWGIVWFFKYKERHGNPVSGLLPKVEMGFGHIGNITDSTIDLRLDLLVHNPLPFEIDVRGFDYQVQMNGVTIVENEHTKPLLLKAHDSTVVALPSQLKIRNLSAEGDKEAKKGEDSANYHFEGVFHLTKPFFGKDTIRLAMDKRLPLYRLPKVEIVGYDMEKFRLNQSEIVLKLKFTNQNRFGIQFKNPSYVVDLGKQKRLAEGSVTSVTKVPGKSTEMFEIPLAIRMGKLIRATGQLIGQGKSLPFTLYFKSKLISENDIFKDSDVNIVVDGELKDLETVQKNLSK